MSARPGLYGGQPVKVVPQVNCTGWDPPGAVTCTAPFAELPDTLMLPAIAKGRIPGTVDVVLNCQLFTGSEAGGVEPEAGPEAGPDALPPAPHPTSTTRIESHKMLAKCRM